MAMLPCAHTIATPTILLKATPTTAKKKKVQSILTLPHVSARITPTDAPGLRANEGED